MLRLKRNLPVSWIGVQTLRIGVQEPAVALQVTDDDARAIVAMREGISKAELVRAVGRNRADELIESLAGCFDSSTPTPLRVRIAGKLPLAESLRVLVRSAHVASGAEAATLLMPVTMWRLTDKTWQHYLVSDRQCLPVIVGDKRVTFGPLWHGNRSACWRCANPTPPHPLPLPVDTDGAIRLDAFEVATVLGCAAEVLRRVQTGALSLGDEALLDRETGAVTWRHVEPLATCPCQADLSAPAEQQGSEREREDSAPTQRIA